MVQKKIKVIEKEKSVNEKLLHKKSQKEPTVSNVPVISNIPVVDDLKEIPKITSTPNVIVTPITKPVVTPIAIPVKKIASSFSKLQMEALLFSSGRTMTEEQLSLLAKVELPVVHKALVELQQDYANRESAITVYNDPTGWKMMIKEQYVGAVKHIVADTELTRACMETLAIIAYKYPKVLQSEVIEIRGSGAYEHMAELERLGFIRRDSEGRSYAVKLTEKFFTYFDVAGGKDIKEVFKNVKLKSKQAKPSQKTLGDLQVIDVVPSHVQKKLGQLEQLSEMDMVDIVDVPDAQVALHTSTTQTQSATIQESDSPQEDYTPHASAIDLLENEKHLEIHNAFLDDLDRRIARITERNTANEQDDGLRRKPLPGAEELGIDSKEPDEEGIDTEHDAVVDKDEK